MKTLLLIPCLAGALILSSAVPTLAAHLPGTGEYELSQADACRTNCQMNAKACREQCTDPEELQQCIVDCDSFACKANCDAFENKCKQHCPSPGG
ncbi:MAG TPA: hypothetical protein VL996_03695 [Methylocella sp.]|nr:hypothetical protein [Methylocella sp.]